MTTTAKNSSNKIFVFLLAAALVLALSGCILPPAPGPGGNATPGAGTPGTTGTPGAGAGLPGTGTGATGGTGAGTGGYAAYVGDWVAADSSIQLDLKPNGNFVMLLGTTRLEGTYTVQGDTIKTVANGRTVDFKFQMQGENLLLTIPDSTQTMTLSRRAVGAGGTGGAGTAGTAGAGAAGAAGAGNLVFKEWKAPDGSITLQVPEGWKATEWRSGQCAVSWSVDDPTGKYSAFMLNEFMVLKSEEYRQIYAAIPGIQSAPVSPYLSADQATAQVIGPVLGSSNVQVTLRNAELSQQYSQVACPAGLAACDAQAFEADFTQNGAAMHGGYLASSYDFGEGTTWWINLWGYAAPAGEWDAMKPTLDKVFNSVKVTDEWMQKCQKEGAASSAIVSSVIGERQNASDQAADAWNTYINQ